MSWSAKQYCQFEAERNRPIRDLLAQIPTAGVSRAIDIGCGPGNSTELLRERFPEATVSGIDSSPDMIEAARKRLPDVRFEVEDIASWRGSDAPFDVILANAALHWVEDHVGLLPRLVSSLAPRGSLAVQIPDNLQEPSHLLMRQIAAEGPWAAKLVGALKENATRHSPDWYYRLLRDHGATVDIWRTTYHHALAGGAHAVVEWFKGSGLRPFIQPLDEPEQKEFLKRYEAALASAYPTLSDGTVLLPFPRLFFVATR